MRSKQNYFVVGVGWGARLVAVVVGFLITPILLNMLGENHYAVLQVLVATLPWFGLLSLGLDLVLKNLVSESRASGKLDIKWRQAVSLLLWISFIISVLGIIIIAPYLSKILFGKLLSGDVQWTKGVFLVSSFLMLLIAFGRVGLETLFAEERGDLVYFLTGVGHIFKFILVYWISTLNLPVPTTFYLVICAMFGPSAIIGLYYLLKTGLLKLPLIKITIPTFTHIARLALKFSSFSLISTVTLSMDYIIMSQILSATEITIYSILMVIITQLLFVYSNILQVVWPQWSRQFAGEKYNEVKQSVTRLSSIGLLASFFVGLIAFIALPFFVKIWLNRPVMKLSSITVLLFFIYFSCRVWTDTFTTVLLSANNAGWTAAIAAVQIIITMPLEVVLGKVWGINGIMLGLIVGFIVTVVWLHPYRFYSLLKHSENYQ